MATSEIHGIGHSVTRVEDARVIHGKGNYIGASSSRTCSTWRSCAALTHTPSAPWTPRARTPWTAWWPSSPARPWRPITLPGCPPVRRHVGGPRDGQGARFQGQEVAAVVAEDPYIAQDALELIDVD